MNSIEKPKSENKLENGEKEAFTSVSRILGRRYEDISEEEKKDVLENIETIFKSQEDFREALMEAYGSPENIPDESIKTIFFERPKNPEEIEIINIINEKTNELRKKFGLSLLNVSPENIYIIPEASWPRSIRNFGYYSPVRQFIVVREQLESISLVLAESILHEMIHFKSYNSLKKIEDFNSFETYRVGLETKKRDGSDQGYFKTLNEAIVEKLTIRLLKELRSYPIFKKEFEQTDKFRRILLDKETNKGETLINGDEFYINFDQEKSKWLILRFEGIQERRILNKLEEKIFTSERNKGKFKNKEDIFNMFVEAAMTGKIVRLGRLIDNSFGEGTFRKVAEESDINKLEELIDGLG